MPCKLKLAIKLGIRYVYFILTKSENLAIDNIQKKYYNKEVKNALLAQLVEQRTLNQMAMGYIY